MNIFERAARRQLRFKSSVGLLSTEELFTLDLVHKSKPNLNAIGVGIMEELKGMSDFNLVETKPNERKDELELQLEIVKNIIESKKVDAQAAETRAKRADLRRQLVEVLAAKEGEALKSMSADELRAKLAELSD